MFIGTTPTQGFVSSFPKQSFTPNGSTTVFTLTNPVASANDLEVFVGNVRQEPTTAYSAAGTTLTMSEAPASGLNFYVINKSFAQVTTTPPVNLFPDGSVMQLQMQRLLLVLIQVVEHYQLRIVEWNIRCYKWCNCSVSSVALASGAMVSTGAVDTRNTVQCGWTKGYLEWNIR